MSEKLPASPTGTGPAGRRLWREVQAAYALEVHEERLLVEATRTIDDLERLRVILDAEGLIVDSPTGPRTHPAAVESRMLRVTLARLLTALRLPAGAEDDEAPGRRPQRRGAPRGVYRIRAVK